MRFKTLFTCLSLCLLSVQVVSCSKVYEHANAEVDNTYQQIKTARNENRPSSTPVLTRTGFYVDTNAVPLEQTPSWMYQHVTARAQNLPFQILLKRLLRDYSIVINCDNSINPNRMVSIDYSGSLKGALDALSMSMNAHYQVKAREILWSALETKTFDISFMPGTSNYFVGQEQNQSNQTNTTNPAGIPLNQLNDSQYSNLSGQLSVWRDLENTVNQLKSHEGRVVVSESTTTLTVSDHPSNVSAISRYIEQLNRRLSQQVGIKVQVLEVELNKNFNYGIDWNLLTSALGTRFHIIGNAGSAANIVNENLNSNNTALSRIGIGSSGADVFIQALKQQGKVRVVTEPEVVTMNNQIAAIRITQSVGYIESVSQTNSQFFSTNSINPGSITDGFTLYLLPKVQNEDVFMQISSTIANLERLEKVSTAPDNNSRNGTTQYQAIQVPTLAQKSFNQRSLVRTGTTLIIAGYKRLRDATNETSFFGVDPLGGRGATSSNVETLVLITPTILHSSHSHVNTNTE